MRALVAVNSFVGAFFGILGGIVLVLGTVMIGVFVDEVRHPQTRIPPNWAGPTVVLYAIDSTVARLGLPMDRATRRHYEALVWQGLEYGKDVAGAEACAKSRCPAEQKPSIEAKLAGWPGREIPIL